MRSKAQQWMFTTLIVVIVFAFVGRTNGQTTPSAKPAGDEAAIEAAAVQVTATVVAVDASKRTVSVVGPLGRTNTYTCGKAVRNFDQIKVGDTVKATLVESVAVVAGPSSAPASIGEGGMVAIAPKGAMPGVVMARTFEITDKIEAIDSAKRMITIEGVSGHPKTVKAGPKVDLAALKAGDDVRLRITEGLAIVVEKPQSGAAQ